MEIPLSDWDAERQSCCSEPPRRGCRELSSSQTRLVPTQLIHALSCQVLHKQTQDQIDSLDRHISWKWKLCYDYFNIETLCRIFCFWKLLQLCGSVIIYSPFFERDINISENTIKPNYGFLFEYVALKYNVYNRIYITLQYNSQYPIICVSHHYSCHKPLISKTDDEMWSLFWSPENIKSDYKKLSGIR